MDNGKIQVYYGEGKGKTTAAMGLCLRAAGHGLRVGLVQFLKDGSSGELGPLSRLPCVRLFPFLSPMKFVFAMTESEKAEARAFYAALWDEITSALPELDVLVLDEVFGAVETGLLPSSAPARLLRDKPPGLELVLTGRHPTQEALEAADYLMEICSRRHPYDQGIPAREGIEW